MSDNAHRGIRPCNGSTCGMCNLRLLDTSTTFYSICSNVKYEINFEANCKTQMLIYLISCKKCQACYVGKTTNSSRDRLNGHRGNIRKGTEAYLMRHHFTKVHNISDMQIKPIELCNKNNLAEREKHWIRTLNTLFPYGLNDRADFGGLHDVYKEVTEKQCTKSIYSTFPVVKVERRKRGKGSPPSNLVPFSPDAFLNDLKDSSANHEHFVHFLRLNVMRLDKEETKQLLLYIIVLLNENRTMSTVNAEYLLYVVKDLCLFKYQRMYVKSNTGNQFVVVEFVNKYLNGVNINKIFNTPSVVSKFPIKNQKYMTPTTSFKYTNTVRSKILNYKQTIFEEDASTFRCNCSQYNDKFVDAYHKHVLTGDTDIVTSKELRKIFTYGPNFREQRPPDKDKAMSAISLGLETYIDSVAKATKTQVNSYLIWKRSVLKACKDKLDKLKPYNYNIILSKGNVKQCLKKLHEDFVIVPVDKAGCNIAFVCKCYYMQVLSKEVTQSTTFQMSRKSSDEISHSNNQFLSKHGIHSTIDRMPFLYWTAKMHKNPSSHRYITSGVETVLSELSVNVTHCLKLLLKFARNSKKYKFERQPGINNISIIDSHNKVIKFMNLCNKSKSKKTIKTYDFSTLYTNIPHDKLKCKLANFISKIFNLKEKKYIIVKGKWSYFSDKTCTNYLAVTAQTLIEWANYVIDNSYILFQGKLYRQVIGIPMGTSCAPYFANIFLHEYEYNYIHKLIQSGDIITATHLSRMFRYQDDCIVLNDEDDFNDHFILMYPSEMVLKCTNISPAKSNFLDMTISVYRGKYKYISYDKRKDFSFDIVNYPNLKGNIPKAQAYGVFISQLVRFTTINDSVNNFFKDAKNMVQKLINQGFKKHVLKNKYFIFTHKYIGEWYKYGRDLNSVECYSNIF